MTKVYIQTQSASSVFIEAFSNYTGVPLGGNLYITGSDSDDTFQIGASKTSTTHSHTFTNSYDRRRFRVSYTVTNDSGNTQYNRVTVKVAGVTKFENIDNSTNCPDRDYDFVFVVNQPGAPTYLEELHKLDRNSSSHYIPR